MRIIDSEGLELTREAADPTLGTLAEAVIIRPDAAPVDNVTKFAYEDGDYETVLRYTALPAEERTRRQIECLKRQLADTDYVVLKLAEGVTTAEEYSQVLAQRQEWRRQINELEVTQ